MMRASMATRCCKIYQGHGEAEAEYLPTPSSRPPDPKSTSGASRVELRQVMFQDLVCARRDLDIEEVIRLMVDRHLGCIPVVDDERRPIGMITKYDIVEHVNAFLRSVANGSPLPTDLAARTADEVMMPLALTLDEDATIGDAASLMTCEDLHHVLVVARSGSLVGVVSSKDIVSWLVRNDGLMPWRDEPAGS